MTKQAALLSLNVAEAKRRFSELLGQVAYGRARILITRRGRPMAELAPPGSAGSGGGLSEVAGWLDADSPFFSAIDAVVERRSRTPRVVAAVRSRKRR
jgi:prevent-host-death family protein